MNWLTRLEVGDVVAIKMQLFDRYSWHQKIWQCFPDRADKNRNEVGFLTRIEEIEGGFRVWILSKERPTQPSWYSESTFVTKQISSSFLSHKLYRFDVIANPVKTKVNHNLRLDGDGNPILRANGKPKRISGKRVLLTHYEDLQNWMDKKAQDGGFRISSKMPLEVIQITANRFKKMGKVGERIQEAWIGGVQFRGVLEVTNSEKFVDTYQKGVGKARGFGFGLFLLSPIYSEL